VIESGEGRFRLRGAVTMANANTLREAGLRVFAAGDPGAVELDLDTVTEVDSSALSLLLEWRRQLARQGRVLRLHGLPPNLRSLAGVYEVLDLLPGT